MQINYFSIELRSSQL